MEQPSQNESSDSTAADRAQPAEQEVSVPEPCKAVSPVARERTIALLPDPDPWRQAEPESHPCIEHRWQGQNGGHSARHSFSTASGAAPYSRASGTPSVAEAGGLSSERDVAHLAQRLESQWTISGRGSTVSSPPSLRNPKGSTVVARALSASEEGGMDSDSEGSSVSVSEIVSERDGRNGCRVQNVGHRASASLGDGALTTGSPKPGQSATVNTAEGGAQGMAKGAKASTGSVRARARAPTAEVAAMSDVVTRFLAGMTANESFALPQAASETAQLRLWRGEEGLIQARTPSGATITLQWAFPDKTQ